MPDREALKQELLESDDEFRRLFEEHQNYEQRLAELFQHSLPSEADELEEKGIKLQKLRLKDRMEAILRSYERERVSA